MKISVDVKPLSVNKAWQGRRFKTDDYLCYENEVYFLLPNGEHVGGMVEIWYTFYLKNHKATDTSNLIKLLEDIMVKKGLIDDDRYVYSFHAKKIPSDVHKIEIEILPYVVA